jgi:transposase
METKDLRHCSRHEIYILKQHVVKMKKLGKKTKDIAACLGITTRRVAIMWNEHKTTGTVKEAKTNGRKYGECKILSKAQESEIRKTLIDKRPDQLKLSFMLWTRQAVCLLIKQRYNIEITPRVMSNYLKSWGMTCQRPTKKAYFQDNVKVEKFKKEEYPTIKARAKAENAEIYWGDETGINNREHYQRGYSPKGTPPIYRVESKLERVNMISAINNYGTLKFLLYTDSMNQQNFIKFLEGLISDATRKVFFIVDNLKVHHGKIVAEWLLQKKDKIELFFIPPYSPELNPVEYLNHTLKLHIHGGKPPRIKADIERKTDAFMKGLQNDPARVKVCFYNKNLAYQND